MNKGAQLSLLLWHTVITFPKKFHMIGYGPKSVISDYSRLTVTAEQNSKIL